MLDESVKEPAASNERSHLVVLLRGWTRFGEIPHSFEAFVRENFPDAGVYRPEVKLSMFSVIDPIEEVDKIVDQISKRYEETGKQINAITIIGYSAGTLLARALVLRAHGNSVLGKQAPNPSGVPWAKGIQHVIMISGILRGWTISSATPKMQRFLHVPLRLLFTMASVWKRRSTFIQSVERGRPLIVALRLGFLNLMNRGIAPKVTYVLGSSDEYISPADAIDMLPGPDVRFFQLPQTDHFHALTVSPRLERNSSLKWIKRVVELAPSVTDVGKANATRRQIYAKVFARDFEEITDHELTQSDIDDYREPLDRHQNTPMDKNIRLAVIVLHGIRDEGFWTKRIAREIKKLGPASVVRAPSPSYGYFSMWNFLNVWSRKRKSYWLMEQYADVKTYFPCANISFVGHSNGTYLGTKAMAMCPEIKFHRMYLVGSVVRRDFEWESVGDQVSDVVNVQASNDVVVACFPGFFELLGVRFFDLGGAGDRGFIRPASDTLVTNVGPLEGGHSAGIHEPLWGDIANYVVNGRKPDVKPTKRNTTTIYVLRFLIAVALVGAMYFAYFVGSRAWGELDGAWYLAPYVLALWLFWRFVKFF